MKANDILKHPLVVALREQRNNLADVAAMLAAENAALRGENMRLSADTEQVKEADQGSSRS